MRPFWKKLLGTIFGELIFIGTCGIYKKMKKNVYDGKTIFGRAKKERRRWNDFDRNVHLSPDEYEIKEEPE